MSALWELAQNAECSLEKRIHAAVEVLGADIPLPRKEHLLWKWVTDIVFVEKNAVAVDSLLYWQLIRALLDVTPSNTAEMVIPRQFLQVITTVGKKITGEVSVPKDQQHEWLANVGFCFNQLVALQQPKLEDLNKCLGVFLQSCYTLFLNSDVHQSHLAESTMTAVTNPCLIVFEQLQPQHSNPRKLFGMVCQRWLQHLLALHNFFQPARSIIESVLGIVLFAEEHLTYFSDACEKPFHFSRDNASAENLDKPAAKRAKPNKLRTSYPQALFQSVKNMLEEDCTNSGTNSALAQNGVLILIHIMARRLGQKNVTISHQEKQLSSTVEHQEQLSSQDIAAYNIVKQFVQLLLVSPTPATVNVIGSIFRIFGESKLYQETIDSFHNRIITAWAASVAATVLGLLKRSTLSDEQQDIAILLVEAVSQCLRDMGSCCYLFLETHLTDIWLLTLSHVWLIDPSSCRPIFSSAVSAVLQLAQFIVNVYAKLRQLDVAAKALTHACCVLVMAPTCPAYVLQAAVRSTSTANFHDGCHSLVKWDEPTAVSSPILHQVVDIWVTASRTLPPGQTTGIMITCILAFGKALDSIVTSTSRVSCTSEGTMDISKSKNNKINKISDRTDRSNSALQAQVVCGTLLWLAMFTGVTNGTVVESRVADGLLHALEVINTNCLTKLTHIAHNSSTAGLLLLVKIKVTLSIMDLCIILLRELEFAYPSSTALHHSKASIESVSNTNSTAQPQEVDSRTLKQFSIPQTTSTQLFSRAFQMLRSLPSADELHDDFNQVRNASIAGSALLELTAFLLRKSTLSCVYHHDNTTSEVIAELHTQRNSNCDAGNVTISSMANDAYAGVKKETDNTNSSNLHLKKGFHLTNAVDFTQRTESEADDQSTNIKLVQKLLTFKDDRKWIHITALFPLIWDILSYANQDSDVVSSLGFNANASGAKIKPTTLSTGQKQLCNALAGGICESESACAYTMKLLNTPSLRDTASAHPNIAWSLLSRIFATLDAVDTFEQLSTRAGIFLNDMEPHISKNISGNKKLLPSLAAAYRQLPWRFSTSLCSQELFSANIQLCSLCLFGTTSIDFETHQPISQLFLNSHIIDLSIAVIVSDLLVVLGEMLRCFALKSIKHIDRLKSKLKDIRVFLVAVARATTHPAVGDESTSHQRQANQQHSQTAIIYSCASYISNELITLTLENQHYSDREEFNVGTAEIHQKTALQSLGAELLAVMSTPDSNLAYVLNSIFAQFPPLAKESVKSMTRRQQLVFRGYLLTVVPDLLTCATSVHFDDEIPQVTVVTLQAISAMLSLIGMSCNLTGANDSSVTSLNQTLFAHIFHALKLYIFHGSSAESTALLLGTLLNIAPGVSDLSIVAFQRLYAILVRISLHTKSVNENSIFELTEDCLMILIEHCSSQQVRGLMLLLFVSFVCLVYAMKALEHINVCLEGKDTDARALWQCISALKQYASLTTASSQQSTLLRIIRNTQTSSFSAILRLIRRAAVNLFVCHETIEVTFEQNITQMEVISAGYHVLHSLLGSDGRQLPTSLSTCMFHMLTAVNFPVSHDRQQALWVYNTPTFIAVTLQLLEFLYPILYELQTKQRRIVVKNIATYVNFLAHTSASLLYCASSIEQLATEKYIFLLRVATVALGWAVDAPNDTSFLISVREKLYTRTAKLADNFARLFKDLSTSKTTLGKYAPYILSGCLLPLSKLMIPGTTRTPFIKGLYPVIDMCTTYDRELVHAALPQDARLLYKRVFDDYKRFHKYKGQF